MASGSFFHCLFRRERYPLCNACVVPSTTLKHDQTCIRKRSFNLSCSPVSTSFLPWFHCEAVSHITNPMFHHIDTAHFSFHPSSVTTLVPRCCCAFFSPLSPPLTPLSGPCCRVPALTPYAPLCLRLDLIPRSSTCEGGLQLAFPSVCLLQNRHHRPISLLLCVALDHHRSVTHPQAWTSRFLSFCPSMSDPSSDYTSSPTNPIRAPDAMDALIHLYYTVLTAHLATSFSPQEIKTITVLF